MAIISIISSQINFSFKNKELQNGYETLKLHLNYTRYIAHIDNKEDMENPAWKKGLWTLKFQRCSSSTGGLYYAVYSDESGGTAHFKKEETLKEPLSNKYLYSNSDCTVSKDESEDVLLTKKYGISEVKVSCNSTSAIGQISFGYDGKIYSKLGDNPLEITDTCIIRLYGKNDKDIKEIYIEPYTGYIY